MRATSSCGNVSRYWDDSRSFVYILGLACSFISSSRLFSLPALVAKERQGSGSSIPLPSNPDYYCTGNRLRGGQCALDFLSWTLLSRLLSGCVFFLVDYVGLVSWFDEFETMNSSSSGCPNGQWFGSVVWRMNLLDDEWLFVCEN